MKIDKNMNPKKAISIIIGTIILILFCLYGYKLFN